jgi:hypothetical protein
LTKSTLEMGYAFKLEFNKDYISTCEIHEWVDGSCRHKNMFYNVSFNYTIFIKVQPRGMLQQQLKLRNSLIDLNVVQGLVGILAKRMRALN